MPLIQLVYASTATRPLEEEPLKELVAKARVNNTRLEVTGLLLYKNESFLQVLEGEAGKTTLLFEKIRQDKRHESVVVLRRRPIEVRSFPDWAMGFTFVTEKRQETLVGFLDFLRVRKFPDLVGDSVLTDRIVNGFKGGPWRAAVQPA